MVYIVTLTHPDRPNNDYCKAVCDAHLQSYIEGHSMTVSHKLPAPIGYTCAGCIAEAADRETIEL